MADIEVEAQHHLPPKDFKIETESRSTDFVVDVANKETSEGIDFKTGGKEKFAAEQIDNEIIVDPNSSKRTNVQVEESFRSRSGNRVVGTFEGEDPMADILSSYHLHKEGQHPKEKRNRKKELYKAAISGDWRKAEEIFKKYPDEITPTTSINNLGETALHIATAADHADFVRYLVTAMNDEDLAIKTKRGDTAFCYAAARGNIEIAKTMLVKNDGLPFIRGGDDILPIRTAALNGHDQIVRLLYQLTKYQMADFDGIDLLMALIDCDMFDIAIQMLNEKLWLAIETNKNEEPAIYSFARKPQITSNLNAPTGGFLTNYFLERRKENLRNQGLELLKLLLELAMTVVHDKIPKLVNLSLFTAAELGNYEFISTVLHLYPHLAFELRDDDNNYTIFHIAAMCHHVDIFNLVHQTNSIINAIRLMKDKQGNNILHLAAELPFYGLQNVVPGAALQLQREWLWFEEVKKAVGPHHMRATNEDGMTPSEVFELHHEPIRREGEKWLTKTADSCMLVSTLIATVAFTGVFSVPGGNGQDTGSPVLLHNIWFKIFAISDAITLIFSASSILFFLSILTSRFAMADFLKSLPFKLLFGLFSLFVSILAMMVAFIAAFFVIFKNKKLQFACPVAAVACIPILLVARLHLPLFFQVFLSTSMFYLQFRRNRFSVRDLKNKYD